MFTKLLSVSLMISLPIDLMLFVRVFLINENIWQRRKTELYSQHVSPLIQSQYQI